MKVLKNGVKIDMSYDDVCQDLGFITEIHFIKITTAGTISFTVGKRHEITSLIDAVANKGYKASKKMMLAVR